MTLRIMLVGLVASMGLEWPSGPEFSCWTQSGRDWVQSRLADLSGPVVEADRPEAEPADCHQADDSIEPAAIAESAKIPGDMAFVAASEAMAAEFAADRLTMLEERSPAEDVPTMVASEAPPAVGLPDGEELASSVELPDDEGPVVLAGSADVGEVPAGTDAPPASVDRFSSALRLTREAVQAWADLMQGSADDVSTTR